MLTGLFYYSMNCIYVLIVYYGIHLNCMYKNEMVIFYIRTDLRLEVRSVLVYCCIQLV